MLLVETYVSDLGAALRAVRTLFLRARTALDAMLAMDLWTHTALVAARHEGRIVLGKHHL
jgi:hypothetical protein